MGRNTSVYFGDHFTRFIEEQVTTGRYSSASDVVRAGLRRLEDEETQEALRRGIHEAEGEYLAGMTHVVDEEFWEELHKEVDGRVARNDTPERTHP